MHALDLGERIAHLSGRHVAHEPGIAQDRIGLPEIRTRGLAVPFGKSDRERVDQLRFPSRHVDPPCPCTHVIEAVSIPENTEK
jgi:hypothetical protein